MILVERVTKRYGATTAVDDVSFSVRPGEIVGFLGPNGAGKSTLLKILSTYLPPDSGRVRIAGFDTVSQSLGARRNLGYLPEHNALFEGMRVDRFLQFIARARGLSREETAARLGPVIERCGLGSVLRHIVAECSKGYRQRIGLAAALVHDPPVLLLDEPTHGLDPLQVVAFRDFIHELRDRAGAAQRDRAILFSSHILSEVAQICDRLLVIQHGRLVADAPLDDLRRDAAAAGHTLEAHVLAQIADDGATRAPASEAATP